MRLVRFVGYKKPSKPGVLHTPIFLHDISTGDTFEVKIPETIVKLWDKISSNLIDKELLGALRQSGGML